MANPSEFDLINWLRLRTFRHPQVTLGIGDDAAALRISPGEELLVTTDMLVAGRHFVVGQASSRLIGRKALAVNLSDIAAMAGRPLAAFISWVLPRQGGRSLAEEIYQGISELAQEFEVSIAGGDTNSWDGPLVINITLVGETIDGRKMTRGGAVAGDWIFVTGPVGGSIHRRQFTFTPRLREARALVTTAPIHAMLDLSDGIASDLRHILRESGVGATLYAERIPIHPDVDHELPSEQRLRHALGDGEDFELLLTTSPATGRKLLESPPPGVQLFQIGTIDADPGYRLSVDGIVREMPDGGWVHTLD